MSDAAPTSRRLSPLVTVLLVLAAALMLMPMLWTLLLSFKSNAALMADSGSAFAPPWTLENYKAILAGSLTTRWLVNSLIVSTGATIGVLVLSSLAGYAFARLEFPFRRTLFVIVLLGLAVPEQAVILPSLTGSFGVFFMTQYFRAIPKELDEAALLDGASRLTLFWKVLLPLTIPAQATLGVFTFLAAWNDYWWPLISATTSDYFTLTVGLASAQMNYAQTSGLGFLMAQAVFASIPILIVYIAFQKQIVRAMAGTAVR